MVVRFVLAVLFLVIGTPVRSQALCFGDCGKALQGGQGKNPMAGLMAARRVLNGMVDNCRIPDFEAVTMKGEKVDASFLAGKVVVMNFWFVTCPPCVKEIPALNRLVKEYSDGEVVFLAMGLDEKEEAESFLAEQAFNYRHVNDIGNKGLIDAFCIFAGFPTNMVFDRDGILQHISAGGNPEEEMEKYYELQPIIEAALKK